MQKGERLGEDLAALQHVWAGSDSALASLRSAARRLDRIASEHPLLGEALAALDRAVIEGGEAEDTEESPDPVGAVDGEPEGIEEDEPTEDRGAVDGDSGELGEDQEGGAVDDEDVSGGTSGGPSGGNASEDEADGSGAAEEN